MIMLGSIELIRLALLFGLLGTIAKGVLDVLPQLWPLAPYLGAGLALFFTVLALSAVLACIAFGLQMRKMASRVRLRGIEPKEKNLWSKVLALDLFSSLIVGAILAAIGLGLALIGILLAPERSHAREEHD